MKLVKVAAGVLNQTPLDWQTNTENILSAIADARERDVRVLCLPELCITGYGCEDAFYAPGVQRTARDMLAEIVLRTQDMIVSVGLPLAYAGGLFDAACLMANQRIIGFAAKRNLAGDGIHYEPRWFKAWPANRQVQITLRDTAYPFGDVVFDCDGIVIGFEICEDAWAAERPGTLLATRGVDIILNPSASHFAFGKHAVRQRFVLEGSRAFNVSYVYANLLGNEAGRALYDGDAMIACGGELLATAPRFSFADYHLTTAVIDVDQTRMQRARSGHYYLDIKERSTHSVLFDFCFPEVEWTPPNTAVQAWEKGNDLKEEEFARAVSLGLLDYLRKSRSRGFVVSLSGGADSATVACLVGLMVRFGVAELGLERFVNKLPYLESLDGTPNEREVIRQLLTCVYQATRNSSQVTREAATRVAEALGAEFLVFDVEGVVRQYKGIVGEAIGRTLSWEQDDLALQNIQARARAPGIWMLANLKQALLLATSNRSEAAAGYATMDGDTAGGLSPIAGIDKAFLRRWLQWLETQGPAELPPLPALQAVNAQQPTAELRPQAAAQVDEEDLMPYEVLDVIERAAIRDKLMPIEVYQRLKVLYGETFEPQQLATWVERFFVLWARNQWKRERYAPSFHLDDENLDPKTWCRYPILSGAFTREVNELREFVRRTP